MDGRASRLAANDGDLAAAAASMRRMRISTRVAPGRRQIPAPCRFYMEGFCANGDACQFIHPPRDNAANSHRFAARSVVSPTSVAAASPTVSLALSPNSHPFTPPPPRPPHTSTAPALPSFAPPRIEDYVRGGAGGVARSHATVAPARAERAVHYPPTSHSSGYVLAPRTVNAPNPFVGFSQAYASVFDDLAPPEEDYDEQVETDALLRAASEPRSFDPPPAFTSSVGAAHASSYAAVAAPDEGPRGFTPMHSQAPVAPRTVPAWRATQAPVASSPSHSLVGSPALRVAALSMSMNMSPLASKGGVLCRFHVTGECRYGERCRYVHGLYCPRCEQNVIHPSDPVEAQLHRESCERETGRKERMKMSENVECGICYERPVAVKRKFGLLPNCEHAFCLSCIRQWRGQESAYNFGREAVRACPVCRVESFLVIPSDSYERDSAVKEELLSRYKSKLKSIPCRHFDYGRGECPFGSSCMYAHLDAQGKPVEEPERPPLLVSDSGVRVKTHARLADYLPPAR